MNLNRRALLTSATAAIATPSLVFGQSAPIKLRDLYARDGSFSSIVTDNKGARLLVEGFMAPPLKANANFFVLTKMPMSVCPFCETSTEWPSDIAAVYMKRRLNVSPFNVRIFVSGIVETGELRDEDTGFVSMLRLSDAVYS